MVTTTAKLTLDEYREQEAIAQVRHEYRNGDLIEMPGGSVNHSHLLMALYVLFESMLDNADYEAFNSDMRLWIPERNQATYPDLMVVTGEPIVNGDRRDEIVNPTLIAEVLSPSTSSYDRGDTFAATGRFLVFRSIFWLSKSVPRSSITGRRMTGVGIWRSCAAGCGGESGTFAGAVSCSAAIPSGAF